MIKLTELCGMRVRTTEGVDLGRVWDVRCQQDAAGCVVGAVLCGSAGLLERIGVRKRVPTQVRWIAVARNRG